MVKLLSFVRSLVRSFVCSSTRSFVGSFLCYFVHSLASTLQGALIDANDDSNPASITLLRDGQRDFMRTQRKWNEP